MRVFLIVAFLFMSFTTPSLAAEDYICAMHPHIHGNKGDHCPICGMALVPASSRKEENQSLPEGSVSISPVYRQALGVKTDKVTYHHFGKSIHTFGRIVPNTRNDYQISLRKSGWIRDLKTSAVGDAVKKGDVLFTLYSPDIINVETEYLTGIKNGFKAGASEARLRLYGMDEQAIALFKKQGEVIEDVPFHAPADGVVTSLNARKGGYVTEGGVILTLQDFSQVWVDAHIPVKDLTFLALGTSAQIIMPQTGEKYSAVINYIYPMADPDSREGMARLVLDNASEKLKTDIPVDVMFTTDGKSRLAVPEEAVMLSGMGAYVFEDLSEGRFRPVMVKTGITSDGLTEIVSGLAAGQRVVTSGQFMLDTESSLRGSMANMPGMDMKDMDMEQSHGK